MIIVTEELLNSLSEQANKSVRKRKNLNFHIGENDTLQRLLNAIEKETYIQPHKHERPPKREVFIILKGKIMVIEFDDAGNISSSVILDVTKGNYAVEVPPCSWHTVISLENGSVYYEVKDGPYDAATDKIFAPWAPTEESGKGKDYNRNIISAITG